MENILFRVEDEFEDELRIRLYDRAKKVRWIITREFLKNYDRSRHMDRTRRPTH